MKGGFFLQLASFDKQKKGNRKCLSTTDPWFFRQHHEMGRHYRLEKVGEEREIGKWRERAIRWCWVWAKDGSRTREYVKSWDCGDGPIAKGRKRERDREFYAEEKPAGMSRPFSPSQQLHLPPSSQSPVTPPAAIVPPPLFVPLHFCPNLQFDAITEAVDEVVVSF